MTQRYAVTTVRTIADGPPEADIVLLRIVTDDDGLILEITPARFRQADARVIEFQRGWTELAQTTLAEFESYLAENFGSTYMLTHEGTL